MYVAAWTLLEDTKHVLEEECWAGTALTSAFKSAQADLGNATKAFEREIELRCKRPSRRAMTEAQKRRTKCKQKDVACVIGLIQAN